MIISKKILYLIIYKCIYYSNEDYCDIKNNDKKHNINSDIKLYNYSWKALYGIMNRIKGIWGLNNYNHELLSEINQLNKILYSNLYQSNNMTDLKPKNSILKNEINSLFQNTLFDFLYEEQDLYDYYDKKFNNHKYTPRNINLPFKSFINYFKNLYLDINSNQTKLDYLKKIRWYIFPKEKKSINFKKDLFKSSIMMMDIEDEDNNNNDDNDIFNDNNNIININPFNNDTKENEIDCIEEKDEKIINNDYIDNLLKNEDNPLLFILKILYLSISSFCKETISYLLTTFSDDESELINNYSKRFDNFVDCAKTINTQCENINVCLNYLYNESFSDTHQYQNFPKFSIFKLFIKIWYKESTSFLVQNNKMTLLNKIKKGVIDLYSNIINKDIMTIQNKSFVSNSNNIYDNNFFFNKNKKLSLSSSISIFNSENLNSLDNNNMNDMNNCGFIPFGSLYDENNSKYYIIEKGLKIIYDSFSNEYNVNLFNLSNISVNNYYNEIENDICGIVRESIKKSFEENIFEKGISIKIVVKHIISIFKDYFYESRIIPKMRKEIYNVVYKSLKFNIFNYVLFSFNRKFKNDNNANNVLSSYNFSSQNTNYSSQLDNQVSIVNFNNIDISNNNDNDYMSEIKNYIIKQTKINGINDNNNKEFINQINNFVEGIIKQENIIELFNNIYEWKNKNDNAFEKMDKKVRKELNKKNLPDNLTILQRKICSYSIDSDIKFIEKINKTKSSIFHSFDNYESLVNSNNLEPFYSEWNNTNLNNNFLSNNINNNNGNDNNDYDIDIGKSVFNLDLNNNFFNGFDKNDNDNDINPYASQNENGDNLNNLNYGNDLNNLDNIYNQNYFGNNYNLNDL